VGKLTAGMPGVAPYQLKSVIGWICRATKQARVDVTDGNFFEFRKELTSGRVYHSEPWYSHPCKTVDEIVVAF
jgi:hypothetical protein